MSEQQKKDAEEEKKKKEEENKNKKKKNKKEKKEKEIIELDYIKCAFPIPYSDERLLENWFEFNDSAVTPIYPGTL